VYEFADEDAYLACDFTGLDPLPRATGVGGALVAGTRITFGDGLVRYFGGKGGPGGADENTFCLAGQSLKLEGGALTGVGNLDVEAWSDPLEWPIRRDFDNTISGVGQSDTITFKYPAGAIPAPALPNCVEGCMFCDGTGAADCTSCVDGGWREIIDDDGDGAGSCPAPTPVVQSTTTG